VKKKQLKTTASTREAAAELLDPRSLSEFVFANVVDAILLWDEAGTMLGGGGATQAIFGYENQELVGRPVELLLPGGLRDRFRSEAGKAVSTTAFELGRPVQVSARRRDGSDSPLEMVARTDSFRGIPVTVAVLREIRGRAPIEDTEQRSSSIRVLMEHLSDAVWVQRADRLVFVNRQLVEMLDYRSSEELLGCRALELIHPRDRKEASARLGEVSATGRPAPLFEEHLLQKDGSSVTAEILAVPILFDGLRSVAGFARDLSERHLLQARLASSDRMASVGRLAAGVAHGINNPLAYVMGNLEFIREELADLKSLATKTAPTEELGARIDDLNDGIEQALEGAGRVRDIVLDLSTFSRSEEVIGTPIDLCPVLDSAINLTWNEIRHCARLVKDFAPVPPVLADESRLAHVFVNLLANAAHSIPEGKAMQNEIRVATGTDQRGRVVVEVRDSGEGIPPEQLPHIFEPFFTTKPVGMGTGLGLSVAHGIVLSLGGELEVESTLGEGSTFRVVLPARKWEPASTRRPGALRTASRRTRVMVVDDEPRMINTMRRMLSPEYEITTAASGREAIARLRSGDRPEVLLCDLMMPEATGMDLYEELADHHPGMEERMIFVTGGAFTPRAERFLSEVPNRHLIKPFSREKLHSLMKDFLSTRQSDRTG
jgi:PAS domain S-box-containing protein